MREPLRVGLLLPELGPPLAQQLGFLPHEVFVLVAARLLGHLLGLPFGLEMVGDGARPAGDDDTPS